MTAAKGWVPPAPLGLGQFFPDASAAQAPADIAVVMPTILRPVIIQAVESVFAQDYAGRIQLLIGVDKASGPKEPLLELLSRRPPNLSAMMLELPYSTSVRHGGLHNATDGGSLRAILSLTANTRYVAYLDDDNAWRPNHVRALLAVMPGKAWAFSQRMLVDQETARNWRWIVGILSVPIKAVSPPRGASWTRIVFCSTKSSALVSYPTGPKPGQRKQA